MESLGVNKPWDPGRNNRRKLSGGEDSADCLDMNTVGSACTEETFLMTATSVSVKIKLYGLKHKVEAATNLLKRLLPGLPDRIGDVEELVGQAFASGCELYGEREALEWAGDFKFPRNVTDRDEFGLREFDNNLKALVKRRQEEIGAKRMSFDSIKRINCSDPDYGRLKELVEGLRIFVASDFVPNEKPPPLRKKYLRVAAAVNKVMMELYDQGLVLFLPTTVELKIPSVHFSSTHWTTKAGKAKGRPLGDCSNSESGSALNSTEAKVLVDAHYGKIEHPTLTELMQMINRQADRVGREHVACWKIDLSGAFTLLFLHSDDVHLAAIELMDGITMFYITGFFGGTGTPASFQVITRVLERHINSLISGEIRIYVDDIMGCCSKEELEKDMNVAITECQGLLGEGSVAHDKTESSLLTGKLTWIGWEVNLATWTVSIGRKNFLKTLYGFFVVNEEDGVPIREIQRLASWASRYSTICRILRPYTTNLYAEVQGVNNLGITKKLRPKAVYTIRLWRIILCMMELQTTRFCRCISSFDKKEAQYAIEYDASLKGLGILVYRRKDEFEPFALWKVSGISTSFAVGHDASYQNAMEFIAIVIATSMLIQLGARNATITVEGDNKSSLAWVLTERFKGQRSQRAAVVYIALGVQFNVVVGDVSHVSGINNGVCDKLSRGVSPLSLGFNSNDTVFITEDSVIFQLLQICDPVQEIVNERDLIDLWTKSNLIISTL